MSEWSPPVVITGEQWLDNRITGERWICNVNHTISVDRVVPLPPLSLGPVGMWTKPSEPCVYCGMRYDGDKCPHCHGPR